MFKQGLKRAGRRFLMLIAASAAGMALVVFQHRNDEPPRPALAKGTPLSVYRMHCASTATRDDDDPSWSSYDISFDPGRGEFALTAEGNKTVLPPAQVSGPIDPSNTDYFIVLTQSQLNTAAGVGLLNLQAVLPMKAGVNRTPLSFQVSVPHGEVLRLDSCSPLD